jgi:hypothetical protein
MSRLEATTSKGVALWIERDSDRRGLDCPYSPYKAGGKEFIELPRRYRTERGAKQAAALLAGERLAWAPPVTVTN